MSSNATTVARETVGVLFQKIIGPFSATGIIPHLVEPDNIEERIQALIRVLETNPQLMNPFRKFVAALQKRKTLPPLEEQIRFFQTSQTRNYLFAYQFNEVLNAKELQVDLNTGKMPEEPFKLLKFANSAKAEFGEESRYKNLMFAIGLYFDFVFYLQKTEILNLNGIKFDDFIQDCFDKGIEQGKVIARLSRHKAKMPNDVHAPVAALLRQLSHIALCLIHPVKGPEFYKMLETIRYTEPLKMAMEIQEFGLHSGMIASYLAQSVPLFDPLGEMMSILGVPHIAHYTKNPQVSELASVCELGILLKESFKIGEISSSAPVGGSVPELMFLDLVLNQSVRDDLKKVTG